ncbi:FAD binding domain-containing protein [Ancylobacter sp. 6x-1]|uniref:FAD binding domain-containing protein n=1 Tax=Ancylobacter crimeensis TaxID=2579147 RepID=A0ABT0DDY6_9HYPH|nr:FAD binding domain-containing protein [Ancylobacter crimeensis]MCK0198181.1 FAD binding domain-containing protein [Ancylobacter crimeensis]
MIDTHPSLYIAPTLGDALSALGERGAEGAAFAGGTWIMRAPIRHQPLGRAYVALGKIEELQRVDVTPAHVEIGACATHATIAAALAPCSDLAVLAEAAGRSANPAVRSAATIGGNLMAADFAAADLVPALLCLEASVEIVARDGVERMTISDFLLKRQYLACDRLLSRIRIERADRRSAHTRLPLRKAGDYPVAIVSLSARIEAGRLMEPRIAVGSVEPVARRWTPLEAALEGAPIDIAAARHAAEAYAAYFQGREGIEAPGWYRISVLPALIGRALQSLSS